MVFYQQKLNKNDIFKQRALSTNEIYWLKISQSSYFKQLYEIGNDQLLS